VPQERGLAATGRPGAGDVAAEELDKCDDARGSAPGGDPGEEATEVGHRADQQGDGECQQGVLGELRRSDRMCPEAVVAVDRAPVERPRGDHRQERGGGDPDRPARTQGSEAAAQSDPERDDPECQHADVGECDMHSDRPHVHRGARLMVDVQKERRQERCHREPAARPQGPFCDQPSHTEMGSRERSDGHRRPLYWPL
jgi:hypothetical protein